MSDSIDTKEKSEQWLSDVFERKQYAIFLTKLLAGKKKPFVLNINAVWGAGKTFFLSHWHEDVKIKHPTVMFNAWKSDYADDPLLTVLSCIKKDLKPLITKNDIGKNKFKSLISNSGNFLKAVAPIIVKGATAKLIGEGGVEELANIVLEDEQSISEFSGKAAEEFLKLFSNSEKSIDNFKKDLSGLITQITSESHLSPPLFIFIDELDRCRPTFAIETLESIKHLFDVPEVVFVIATDTDQMSHSVKAIYGEGFDGRVYLRRFFDQEYTLPEPNFIKFASMLFKNFKSDGRFFDYAINPIGKTPLQYHDVEAQQKNDHTIICGDTPNQKLVILFSLFSEFFDLDLRTQKQCFDKFEAIAITIDRNEELHSAYIIFLIILEAKKPDEFKEFFCHNLSMRRKVIQDLGESLVNIRSYGKLFTAINLINIYGEYTFKTLIELREILNISSDGLDSAIASSIFNNIKKLSSYKSKVELVGALS